MIKYSDISKKFKKVFYDFLSSKIKGSLASEEVRKTTLINLFAFCSIFFLLFYSYRMYLLGDYKLTYIYLFCFAIIVALQTFLRHKRKVNLVSHLLVIELFCLEFFFLYRNGSVQLNIDSYYIFPGIYWYYIFPLFTIFLLGRKVGTAYNLVLIAITIIFFAIDSPMTKLYDFEFEVRFLSIYSAIFFLALFFESNRAVTFSAFQKMQEKNVEYSRKIMDKNKDLRRKNKELLMLTEEVRVQMEYHKDLNVLLELKNQKIVSQNQQLEIQSNEISNQRDLLLIQKQNITDSILYASHIQKALLPSDYILNDIFSDHFILYKPRDIIGGDFYYVKKFDNTLVLAVADCTGHGVPGALLSMLGISYLNEIIHTKELSETNTILNEMRDKIKFALHQSNQTRETKDGMDMALVAIDLNSKILKYSGANNPIYIIRDSALIELKADKMPIGIQPREKPNFSNLEFQLQKDDSVYLFSDGYADQIDKVTMKKFSLKNFQKLLVSIANQGMTEQRDELEAVIERWRNNEDQTDDILVVGVRI
ncbi:MAG: hypothetical protein EHM93_15190 [Bacteroidales bacterium]|nr:MAG: hypothetical protein EHM93_15190 [Bacteroidales bacterium]